MYYPGAALMIFGRERPRQPEAERDTQKGYIVKLILTLTSMKTSILLAMGPYSLVVVDLFAAAGENVVQDLRI